MLKFNVKRMFAARGIERMTGFLVKLGMTYPRASRFLKAQSGLVKIKDIERLCIALNCTPNDLFEWLPDTSKTVLPETHALNALNKGAGGTKNLQDLFKDIPAGRLGLIEQLLNELKSKRED